MKNYSKITENKDILTVEYADSIYAKLNNIPKSVNGLGGGTLTGPLTLTGGDGATASKIILSSNGQITDSSTSTMLGFSGGNYIVGSGSYPTTFRGKQTRPPWNGKDLALYSDIPTIPTLAKVATSGSYNDLTDKPTIPPTVTESTVSGWGFTKNIGTVTSVKANGTNFNPDSTGKVDLGNLGGGSGPLQFADTVVMTEAEFSQAYLAGTLQDDKLYLIEGETGTVNFVSTADHIVYNNANSGLTATNLQGAVDEMCQRLLTTAQLNKLIALLDKLTVANDSVSFSTTVKATTFDVQ